MPGRAPPGVVQGLELEAPAARRPFLGRLLWACTAIGLANAPFWLLGARYSLLRPIFNADEHVALLAAGLGALPLAGALLLAWSIDVLQGLSLVYHFPGIADFVRTFGNAGELSWRDFASLEVGAALMPFVAALGAISWIMRRHRPGLAALLLALAAVTAADIVNGTGLPTILQADGRQSGHNVQGSPSLNLASQWVHWQEGARTPLVRWTDTGMPDLLGWATGHPQGSILVVVVESWGEFGDPALRQWVERGLHGEGVAERWRVRRGLAPFKGSTTYGELRVLCGLHGHYSRLGDEQASGCLPNALRQTGYSSTGLHGFTGRFFDRQTWWPRIGLDHQVFAESMPASARRCGLAVPGTCDADMLSAAVEALSQRRLVYLLTLNTHLPLESLPIPEELRTLCNARSASESVCQLASQVGRFLDGLATALQGLPDAPYVVVTGDHSPPFLVQRDRQTFSPSAVPLVVMEPIERTNDRSQESRKP